MNDRTAPVAVAAWTCLHGFAPVAEGSSVCRISGPLADGETIDIPGYEYAQNESAAKVYVRVLVARRISDIDAEASETSDPPLVRLVGAAVRVFDALEAAEDKLERRLRGWIRDLRLARMQRIARRIDEADGYDYATRIVVARPDGEVDWFSTDIPVQIQDILYAVRKRDTGEKILSL